METQKWEKAMKCFSYIKPRLHSFDLWEPPQRRLQPPRFTNTNWKEAPNPWFTGSNLNKTPTPYLTPPCHSEMYESINLSLLLSLFYHCHCHCHCLQSNLEIFIHKLHLQTLGWNPSPSNPRSNKTSFTFPYIERKS